MKNSKANSKMQTKTVPSIGPRCLAAAMLLLLAGGAAEERETNTLLAKQRPNVAVLLADDLG